jgi:hypothetical protein
MLKTKLRISIVLLLIVLIFSYVGFVIFSPKYVVSALIFKPSNNLENMDNGSLRLYVPYNKENEK